MSASGSLVRKRLARLGSLLEYPRDLALLHPEAALEGLPNLESFFSETATWTLETHQEYYVKTFDVTPPCSLYLSVPLFGEESFKRAELMAGLKKIYESTGLVELKELPDHLAVVLKENERFSDEDWSELVACCLLPALPVMIGPLETLKSPYAGVLKTVEQLLNSEALARV